MLMSSTLDNEKLTDALMQIESLQRELSEEKAKGQKKVHDLLHTHIYFSFYLFIFLSHIYCFLRNFQKLLKLLCVGYLLPICMFNVLD